MFQVVVTRKDNNSVEGLYEFRKRNDAEDFLERLPDGLRAAIHDTIHEPGNTHIKALERTSDAVSYQMKQRRLEERTSPPSRTGHTVLRRRDIVISILLAQAIWGVISGLLVFAFGLFFYGSAIDLAFRIFDPVTPGAQPLVSPGVPLYLLGFILFCGLVATIGGIVWFVQKD